MSNHAGSIEHIVEKEWTQEEVIALCRRIEAIASHYGYHVGFTGGTLYKEGRRKDADIIIYPHDSSSEENPKEPDWLGLQTSLERELTITIVAEHYGWLKKAKYLGFKDIDFFFMVKTIDRNVKSGDYPVDNNAHIIECDVDDELGDLV